MYSEGSETGSVFVAKTIYGAGKLEDGTHKSKFDPYPVCICMYTHEHGACACAHDKCLCMYEIIVIVRDYVIMNEDIFIIL